MTAFSNAQLVTLVGYTDIFAMEPEISFDDGTLFFNNSNDPSVDTNLHYATRGANYTTFTYGGQVAGANTTFLEGTPSISQANDLYYITTRSYAADLETTYVGAYGNGAVASVVEVTGLSKKTPGWLIFDLNISRDGNTALLTDGLFPGPSIARIELAKRVNRAQFSRLLNSDSIMRNVNVSGLNYGASLSVNGLELFFTRASPGQLPQIMTSQRNSVNSSFGIPSLVDAATGYVEAPSLSSDGHRLYFHKQNASTGGFDIWMASR